MTEDRKARDKALNAAYMAVLKGALAEADIDAKDVDKRLGIAEGSTARWLRNGQIMRAPMFVQIAAMTKESPSELFARATSKARAAGLLDHVTVLADVPEDNIIEWTDVVGRPAASIEGERMVADRQRAVPDDQPAPDEPA